MTKTIVLGTLLASLLTGGAALAAPGDAPRGFAPAYHQVRHAADWTSLGHVTAGARWGNSTLEVGRQAGAFSKLRLIIKRGDAAVRFVKITFGNGETTFAPARGVIDLPGEARNIRSIEVVTARNSGRALVEVLGERAERMPRRYAMR